MFYIQGAEKNMDTFCTMNLICNLIRQSKAEIFFNSLQETSDLFKENIVLKVTICFGIPYMQCCHILLCAASVVE